MYMGDGVVAIVAQHPSRGFTLGIVVVRPWNVAIDVDEAFGGNAEAAGEV